MQAEPNRATRSIRWPLIVPAACWVVVAVIGWPLLGESITIQGAVRTIAISVISVLWAAAAISLSVASIPSLTTVRVLAPGFAIGSALLWISSGDHLPGAITTAAASIAAVLALSGEFGRTWIQASAYGDEERFPLRSPSAFLVAAIIVWLLATGGLLIGLAALGRSSAVAIPALVIGGAFAALGVPRWHRLARRWLVLVPAGVVVHDPLVLLETAMWRRHTIAGATLATVGTEAADLTGPASGHLIELSLAETATVVMSDGRRNPRGRAIHLTAGLVAPTRPGAALTALRRRGITG